MLVTSWRTLICILLLIFTWPLFFCSCADQEFCYIAVRDTTEQYTVVMILLGSVSLDSSEAIIMTTLGETESK